MSLFQLKLHLINSFCKVLASKSNIVKIGCNCYKSSFIYKMIAKYTFSMKMNILYKIKNHFTPYEGWIYKA